MTDRAPQPIWRFMLPWAELDVFTRDDAPEALQPTAAALARVEDRFCPALLRLHRGGECAFVAVWPTNRPQLQLLTTKAEPTTQDMQDVVLAEIHSLTCRACEERFRVVYPDLGIPFFGSHLAAHRLINECPVCGNDFTTSRIQALALLPPP
ncbi:hypothetical protein [Streptomyces sp. NPDC086010]|uniref:hypothetical protein n=1 Tax=Streptomyces sp. NPDC086010 TaxID=3365745 RepID=UPI0037D6D931